MKAKKQSVLICCAACGSPEVRHDADVEWNVKEQKWEIVSIFDSYSCEDCGGTTRINETPMRNDRYSPDRDELSNYTVIDLRELYKLWEEEHLRKLFPYYDMDCIFDVDANYGQYAHMLTEREGPLRMAVVYMLCPSDSVTGIALTAGLWQMKYFPSYPHPRD